MYDNDAKLSKYAASLGLAVPPRLRFLEKDKKILENLAAAGETGVYRKNKKTQNEEKENDDSSDGDSGLSDNSSDHESDESSEKKIINISRKLAANTLRERNKV